MLNDFEVVEVEKVPAPQAFLQLVKQLNETAFEKEAVLQCEESGAKVANLQGFLAGVRNYKKVMRDNGYEFDIKYDGTQERACGYFDDGGCVLDLHELRVAISDITEFTDTKNFEQFKEKWQQAVDIKKDWLFYISEKGRDLHFIKGWYEAMKMIDDIIERLNRALEAAEQEAANSLPLKKSGSKGNTHRGCLKAGSNPACFDKANSCAA